MSVAFSLKAALPSGDVVCYRLALSSIVLYLSIPVDLLVGDGRTRNGKVAFPLHVGDDIAARDGAEMVDRKRNVVCLDALYKTTSFIDSEFLRLQNMALSSCWQPGLIRSFV